jgi:hypothetical protein
MASPCDLGFLRALWPSSKNKHPKRTMRKLYCLLWPTLASQVASLLLFAQPVIVRGGTGSPCLDEKGVSTSATQG